jgi:hypothetical protein
MAEAEEGVAPMASPELTVRIRSTGGKLPGEVVLASMLELRGT